jgi:hypothetical protein
MTDTGKATAASRPGQSSSIAVTGESGVIPGHVAAQLVSLVLAPFAGEDGNRCRRVVSPGSTGHPAGAGAAGEDTGLDCLPHWKSVVIRVQVVAEERVRHS